MDIAKVPLSELSSHPLARTQLFICSASFEERTVVLAKHLQANAFRSIVVFLNKDSSSKNTLISHKIHSLFPDKTKIAETFKHNPVQTAITMEMAIEDALASSPTSVLLDLTTFTHEGLMILFKALWRNRKHVSRLSCLYLGASEYSIGDKDEEKWLSKGCKNIRNIVGYPGLLIPGRKRSVFVLVGYEHERASRMVSELDPDFLFLGRGSTMEVTNEAHRGPMKHFYDLLNATLPTRASVVPFEFSCRDPYSTTKTLEAKFKEQVLLGRNVIVVPMNTKISTAGVTLAAIRNPYVQVVYAEPEMYNEERYAEPGRDASIFEMTLDPETPA